MVNIGEPFQRAALWMVIAIDIEAGDAALHVLACEKTVPELGGGVGAS